MEPTDQSLVQLGMALKDKGYRFTTVTPLSHARVNARPDNAVARTLEDVFGWSRPFRSEMLPTPWLQLLTEAVCVTEDRGLLKSTVRFSSLDTLLLAHSCFPTKGADTVFFGPDTYRFVRAIKAELAASPSLTIRRLIDIGCGSGAGGLAAAGSLPDAPTVVLTDINPEALRFAQINAAINGIPNVEAIKSDVLGNIADAADLIIANPPYLLDPSERLYRHGGGTWGGALSLRIVRESLARLTRDGCLLLYTGTPIINGHDPFLAAVRDVLDAGRVTWRYEEIDPDVFGEELDRDAYLAADRLAVVLLTVNRNE